MQLRRRGTLIGLGLAAAIVPAGISVADDDSRPKITRVHSRAEVSVTSERTTTCRGSDDRTYTVVKIRGTGPITSDDPRLNGTFHVDAWIMLGENGQGIGHDDWKITDPRTGQLKARGRADGVLDGANPSKSLSIGEFADGSRLVANSLVTLPPPGVQAPIVIEWGGPGSPAPDDAVIVRGSCADVP